MHVPEVPSLNDVATPEICNLQQISEKIQDPDIRTKFCSLPAIIADWLDEVGGVKGKRVLDFGSGYGYTACGMAKLQAPAYVLGVDINDEHVIGRYNIEHGSGIDWPSNLHLKRIEPGEKITGDGFDIVYSWSVFEHIHLSILNDVIRDLHSIVNPGGYLFVQIAPLFFSKEGGHLWELGFTNWEHLSLQLSDLRHSMLNSGKVSPERGEELWAMFSTLNRVTADDLRDYLTNSGFRVLKQRRDLFDGSPPAALETAYRYDVLRCYQVVLLLQKVDQ